MLECKRFSSFKRSLLIAKLTSISMGLMHHLDEPINAEERHALLDDIQECLDIANDSVKSLRRGGTKF